MCAQVRTTYLTRSFHTTRSKPPPKATFFRCGTRDTNDNTRPTPLLCPCARLFFFLNALYLQTLIKEGIMLESCASCD